MEKHLINGLTFEGRILKFRFAYHPILFLLTQKARNSLEQKAPSNP
ncbi:hypothetical protein C943_00453 [Mariniradius saccharolyticus AK6]|uniref:Uncharacterized protein n=1 Tax=Mariniradius saccharolyticus AK6 TaxID=1239962 RepID=M7Y7H2_9BACT|nr:hypothetical protein C943_00453 [Mariniradius saccharolyticus AK6]